MRELLEPEIVDEWLGTHPDWAREGEAIRRDVQAPSFPAGIDLVRRVADAAEERDHHPDIDIRWRTVTFVLSTHSSGGITRLDLELAEVIDAFV